MAGSIYRQALGSIRAGMYADETRESMRTQIDRIAQEAQSYAKSIAPVGTQLERDAAPGTFRASISWKELPDRNHMPAAQVFSEAVNPAGHKYSIFVEYGSRGHKGAGVFAATRKYIQRKVNSGRIEF